MFGRHSHSWIRVLLAALMIDLALGVQLSYCQDPTSAELCSMVTGDGGFAVSTSLLVMNAFVAYDGDVITGAVVSNREGGSVEVQVWDSERPLFQIVLGTCQGGAYVPKVEAGKVVFLNTQGPDVWTGGTIGRGERKCPDVPSLIPAMVLVACTEVHPNEGRGTWSMTFPGGGIRIKKGQVTIKTRVTHGLPAYVSYQLFYRHSPGRSEIDQLNEKLARVQSDFVSAVQEGIRNALKDLAYTKLLEDVRGKLSEQLGKDVEAKLGPAIEEALRKELDQRLKDGKRPTDSPSPSGQGSK
ncbi:MAG: hypothetical protein HYZ53_16025 [Planctomycetes bacterium]|nr:hypothetical protein [Planctomycetota bacterium]